MIKGISLNLVLKKKWFEMIEAREKTEEYREIKLYWMKRIFKRRFSFVTFSYGYTKRRITFFLDGIEVATGRTEWGAEPGVNYYVIKLGERVPDFVANDFLEKK